MTQGDNTFSKSDRGVSVDTLIDFWKEASYNRLHPQDEGHANSEKFALDLHPVPWAGNLSGARVYFLYVNPGLDGKEHECEKNPIFQSKIISNLGGKDPYFYLSDEISFHPGHSWAKKVFGADINNVHAEHICALQLVPYHSRKGDYARRISRTLPSSILIRKFVSQTLLPRALKDEIGLVVTRSSKYWDINNEYPNVVIYKFPENVGGYQTKKTRGGQLLRRFIN